MPGRSLTMLTSTLLMGAGLLWALRAGGPAPVPGHLPLSDFPLSIGDYAGSRLPVDRKTAGILNADGTASVLFRKAGSSGPGIAFFSVFYDRQTPEKNIHSPENCLPSSGWSVLSRKTLSLSLVLGEPPVRASYDVIQKGLDRQVVLYWYQERGRTFSNDYLGRYYMIRDALVMRRTDGAMVRVSTPVDTTARAALAREISFLRTLAPLLSRYIPGGAASGTVAALTLSPEKEDQR